MFSVAETFQSVRAQVGNLLPPNVAELYWKRHYFETREQLTAAIVEWERPRNEQRTSIDWRFTTADVRIKPKRLHPVI